MPGQIDAYLAALKENGAAAVHEPGCHEFNITVSPKDPNHVFIFEVYDNAAAFEAHRATDHFKKYAATTKEHGRQARRSGACVGGDEHEEQVSGARRKVCYHMAKRQKGVVGIVGLGIMGGAFAQNLARRRLAGDRLRHRSRARRRALARAGVEIAADAGALAVEAPIIITSLPKPAALDGDRRAPSPPRELPRRVVIESQHLHARRQGDGRARLCARPATSCSTVRSAAPASQAKTKDLVIYAERRRRRSSKLRPLFADFTRAVHDLGAFGNGSKMKYVANLLVAIHNVASAEAMVLGMKAGLPPQLIFDLIRIGAGNSRVFELRAPMMVKGRYDDADHEGRRSGRRTWT